MELYTATSKFVHRSFSYTYNPLQRFNQCESETKNRTMITLKQKIVIEVSMPDDKYRKKAKKIVAMTEGLISMAVEADKNKLVIVGIGIDAAILTTLLRRKVGRATIISIEEVKSPEKIKEEAAAKKKKEDEEAAKKNNSVPWSYNNHYQNYVPAVTYHGYDVVPYRTPSYPNSWFSW